MGVVIMLGMLFGIIAIVYGLVLRFDPEARRAAPRDADASDVDPNTAGRDR